MTTRLLAGRRPERVGARDLFFSAVAVFVALSLSAAPAANKGPRTPKQYTIEQFFATTTVRDASFSSDEKRILFSSNQTGVFNVYSVPASGGAANPLTASTTASVS